MQDWDRFFQPHYEDDQLLVVRKVAGVLTMGQSVREPSVLAAVREYLAAGRQEIADPFVAIVGRLDHPVAGLLLVAKSPEIADHLWKQVKTKSIRKRYRAIVEGHASPSRATLTNWLAKDRRRRSVSIVEERAAEAQQAILRYRVLNEFAEYSELEVELQTGRKHQIRAQLAHHGIPIVGDRKYGAKTQLEPGIALACTEISLSHPAHHRAECWSIKPPVTWNRFRAGKRELQ
jgi:23S rRNA pseudouridine1911/1915/1917 synthase